MKGQQLFYSFLPGVTAAVLTTQPAWANTVIDGVQWESSPNVLTANHGQASVKGSSLSSESVVSGFKPTNKSVNNSTLPSITVDAVISTAQIPQSDKKPDIRLQTVLPTSASDTGTANLLVGSSRCIENQGKSQSNFSAAWLESSSSCSSPNLAVEWVAQNHTPASTITSTPTDIPKNPQSTGTVIPVVNSGVQNPDSIINVIPGANSAIKVRSDLNPNPNPLLFPTKPEEVTSQGTVAITLSQALELAKRNNNDLQVSLLQLERSQASLREAQASLFPTFDITTSLTHGRDASSTLSAKLSDTTAAVNDTFSGQAQLAYNLYTSGRRIATIKQAEEQLRFDELAVESKAEDIRLNVSTDYYNLQQADEQVRISQSAVQNAQASLRDAQALEQAGVGTRFDTLRSQVNLANAQQQLTRALSQQLTTRRQLATRLSLSQSVNISAADAVQLAGLWEKSLEQSIILAYQNRPELQQQLAQRNISEQQRKQALSSLEPQISLIANYNLLDRFNDSVNVSDGYSVGVQASLNLFDGGAAKAKAAQAKKNIAIAEVSFAEQRNQIRFQVEQAFYTHKSNLDNVQTANAALEQAREALRLARLRFQAGVGTQTDVINSENDLTSAEGNRVTAILDYNRALTQLQRYVTLRGYKKL